MRSRTNAVMPALLSALVLAGCARHLAGAPNGAGFLLNIQFDGGYVYRIGGKDAVEVISLGESKPHPHPMWVEVRKGTVQGGPSRFEVKRARLEFWPDGNRPPEERPELPAAEPDLVDCKDGDLDKDSLSFLPSLEEAAAGMHTDLVPSPLRSASLLLTGGGKLKIAKVGGCVEYRYPDKATYGPKRWMASGEKGIHYDWNLATAATLTLRLVFSETESKTIAVVTPEQDGTQWVIKLEVGSSEKPPGPPQGGKIDHFDSFHPVFESVDPERQLSLWWIKGSPRIPSIRSPGIDCPSGSDP